jgi:K+-sensing histidine kinase KdpD
MTDTKELTASTAKKLDNLHAISQVVNQESDWKEALDKIVPLARAIFIFDNIVLYTQESKTGAPEVAYARAVGRGRSAEADLVWGENTAHQVLSTREIYLQQPVSNTEGSSRLEQPHVLGIPLKVQGDMLGVLVYIRFGGPIYISDNLRVAAFIAEEIAHLLERKKLKEESDQLEIERHQARLQEDFVSTISHELLTPLGFIKGYTTTLLRPDTHWDDNSQREFLNIIDQETDRLQELIDNVLDSARLQSGTMKIEFQPVRLDAVVRDVILRARNHNKNLQVLLKIETPIVPVQGDPRRLAQVLDNLLNNAIKYAPGAAIIISVARESDQMHIQMQDNGPGIPTKYIPYLFERFFRNPEQALNVRGTGLGLYICRQIIEAHHGQITIESYLGEGTTVNIYLPCDQQNLAGSAKTKRQPEGKTK